MPSSTSPSSFYQRIRTVAIGVVGVVVRFGLPRVLKALGIHPDYPAGHFPALKGRRVLIVGTNCDELKPLKKKTGVALSELSAPYYDFLDQGMVVDFASPLGGNVPIDPQTTSFAIRCHHDERFLADAASQDKLRNSIALADVDISQYDMVYFAGGWGAAYDLGQSSVVASATTKANAQDKVIGSACHGALALINATTPDGSAPLVQGRRVTAVTDAQVSQLGINVTPLHPEAELRKRGAVFSADTAFRDLFATSVVVDGNLVTGQNQNSAGPTAQAMMQVLNSKL